MRPPTWQVFGQNRISRKYSIVGDTTFQHDTAEFYLQLFDCATEFPKREF